MRIDNPADTGSSDGVARAYVGPPGRQVHYRSLRTSDGQPMLLLHQVSSSSRMYEAVMPFLADGGYTPIAMDFPGFGGSDAGAAASGVSRLAESTLRFLDDLGIDGPVVLMGHHTGAKVAVEIAAIAPDRVSALVLAGLPYYGTPEERERRWRAKTVLPMIPEADAGHVKREWERLRALSPTSSPDLLHRELVDTLAATRYDLVYAETFPFDVGPRAPLVRCPTLLIAGRRDVLSRAGQEAAARLFRDSRVVMVPEGGVFMVDEHAPTIARIVGAFLDERLQR